MTNKQITINETDNEIIKKFKTSCFETFGLMLLEMRKVDNNYKPMDNSIKTMIKDYLNTTPFCENEDLCMIMDELNEQYIKNIEYLTKHSK